jgi:hypothetical protein
VPETITSNRRTQFTSNICPSFVKCCTFHIAKQQHIILSRMVESKDCIAVSRMCFTYMPPWQPGPWSYPLYAVASVHS